MSTICGSAAHVDARFHQIAPRGDDVALRGVADVLGVAERRDGGGVGERQTVLPGEVGAQHVGQVGAIGIEIHARRIGCAIERIGRGTGEAGMHSRGTRSRRCAGRTPRSPSRRARSRRCAGCATAMPRGLGPDAGQALGSLRRGWGEAPGACGSGAGGAGRVDGCGLRVGRSGRRLRIEECGCGAVRRLGRLGLLGRGWLAHRLLVSRPWPPVLGGRRLQRAGEQKRAAGQHDLHCRCPLPLTTQRPPISLNTFKQSFIRVQHADDL